MGEEFRNKKIKIKERLNMIFVRPKFYEKKSLSFNAESN
jgi:hypothetical protein